MYKFIILTCLFSIMLLAQSQPADKQVTELIKTFSRISEPLEPKLEILQTNSSIAIKMLIAELKPVQGPLRIPMGKEKKYSEIMYLINSVRALRYFTGQNFTATTNYCFREREKQIFDNLTYGKKSADYQMDLFVCTSTWTIYIAPQDVQVSIIKQWQDWYIQNKDKAFPKKNVPVSDWYF
ncbi:MAG: hypothetical protein LWX56_11150 [Ignavibacteria bacterium]|nr:hypothetical protein [Ignavibacteria bacterium]